MANRFAEELREGYRRVADRLSEEQVALVARARDPINVRPVERNRCLALIVCSYRYGSREIWGPVLLDLMSPTIALLLPGFRPVPPVVDEDEIRQQLVVETLRAAACIPLHESGYQTRFRLASRAQTNMLRWLSKESRRRSAERVLSEREPAR